MDHRRIILAWLALGATFLWFLAPDIRSSPAVLWPSVLAIGTAFLLRDIYVALFFGAFGGALLVAEGNPVVAFIDLFSRYLLPALADEWNAGVLVFTLMMGGLAELLVRNGGMTALSNWVLGGKPDTVRAGLTIYFLGWLVFFDGLANAMLVGNTMRSVADRAGLSREKLAFIVDSTSSPIAGVALISTWVAYEMSVIRQGYDHVGATALAEAAAPFQLLVQSLPHRFYIYFALGIVLFTIVLRRDLGPMRRTRAVGSGSSTPSSGERQPSPPKKRRMALALVPIVFLITTVFGGLYVEGGGWGKGVSMQTFVDSFGEANAALVFVCATAGTVLLTMLLSWLGVRSEMDAGPVTVFFEGMRKMFLPALVLAFAWTLNGVLGELGTVDYLVTLVQGNLSPALLPSLVFLLAAVTSFGTGTSWGTMAVVMPLIIPIAVAVIPEAPIPADHPVLVGAIGAVLAGSVFGDHCSPISDTTLVSAISTKCDPMEHVRTQLPYALLAAGLALFLGYLPTGMGIPALFSILAGLAASWMILRYLGTPMKG